MSKYTELQEILKEDIEAIVEQRLAERMESIIESLMPSILEHVANSFRMHTHHLYSDQTIKTHQLVMHTNPGTTRSIGEHMVTINQYEYEKSRADLLAAYQTLNYRISQLEQLSHESKP